MKIGILGSGMVGQTLANGFLELGHEVMIGTRNSSKLDDWKENAGEKGAVGTFVETASFGELLVLAVKGMVAKEVLDMAGQVNFTGKTVIDATNPIAPNAPDNGVLRFFTQPNESLMERLQAYVQQANFVKAFNSIGSGHMIHPKFESTPTMFICGNNEVSKATVTEFLEAFGWEVEDMGGAESARAIEPLCMLWCIPGFLENKWNHAFKFLKA